MRMQSRLLGLPLHPMLVHFPIAFWTVVPVLDAVALVDGSGFWWKLALGTAILGGVTGAAAIVAGLVEYLQPSVVGIDMRLAARHGVRTTLAWCVFSARIVIAAVVPLSTAL